MKRPVPLSDDTPDKLQACLNHCWRRSGRISGKEYFTACARWWKGLTPDQQETCITVIDEYRLVHLKAAARAAGKLPTAPKCPL